MRGSRCCTTLRQYGMMPNPFENEASGALHKPFAYGFRQSPIGMI